MKTCSIDGCAKKHNARGLCHAHYRRWLLYGDPEAGALPRDPRPPTRCQFDGCEWEGKVTRGLCPTHYMRLLRRGDPAITLAPGKPGEGRVKHPMYGAWSQMINRCHNPNNSSFGRYGARGIRVCQRWRDDFLNFLADMGERPEGMTLDRIDPKGPYAPDNCRWADSATQRRNISAEGDQRMREAMSRGVKERWAKWREANVANAVQRRVN